MEKSNNSHFLLSSVHEYVLCASNIYNIVIYLFETLSLHTVTITWKIFYIYPTTIIQYCNYLR